MRALIFSLGIVLLTLGFVLGCQRTPGTTPSAGEVVLYCSVDDVLARQVVEVFEKETNIKVRFVGDNEANKTTGLVQRLMMEKSNPTADIWWSSEPFGTIQLAREGILEPYVSNATENSIEGGWPEELRRASWYGFAQRCRVIAYAPGRVQTPPRSLVELVDPKWNNRIGMARPAFGTTRGHMGVLLETWGPEQFARWLESLQANGLRLYDGNASVVRAIRLGEIDVGLTDTDDVWAGQRNGWNIEPIFEQRGIEHNTFVSTGTVLLPNTVALVRRGPSPDNARRLFDFLLSARVETLMAESESRNIPARPALQERYAELMVGDTAVFDLEAVAIAIDEAMAICDRVFERP